MEKITMSQKKERSHINHLASKIRLQYPTLYQTAGSRYVRQLIRNVHEATINKAN